MKQRVKQLAITERSVKMKKIVAVVIIMFIFSIIIFGEGSKLVFQKICERRETASVGKDCYLEVSYVHGNSRIGSHSVLSYIDVQDQVIPDAYQYRTPTDGALPCGQDGISGITVHGWLWHDIL